MFWIQFHYTTSVSFNDRVTGIFAEKNGGTNELEKYHLVHSAPDLTFIFTNFLSYTVFVTMKHRFAQQAPTFSCCAQHKLCCMNESEYSNLKKKYLKILKETSRFNLFFFKLLNNVIFKEIFERCLLYLHKVTIETKHTTSNVIKKRIGGLNCAMNQIVVMLIAWRSNRITFISI